MQLASYGSRARHLTRLIPHNPGIGLGRSIHIPSVRPPTAGTAQKVVNTTRNLLTRVFALLTAPGLRAPISSFPATPRSLYTASRTSAQGIHANLSFPTRQALSRGPFLPRAPTVQRSVTQVGLGTARNFSSARPIFQNLAQNVPVAVRAFWEADWEIKGLDDERVRIAMYIDKEDKPRKGGEMMKPLRNSTLTLETESDITEDSEISSDLEHYFPPPATSTAQVTTYLLIPLAPTPTSRLPLSLSSSPYRKVERLFPLPQLSAMHTTHFAHSLRVSSLFARLDQGGVWDKGVTCDAYSFGGEYEGVCTVLRVAFEGWTQAEVRSIIGESGTGWCELVERYYGESSVLDDDAWESGMSDLSSIEDRQEHQHQDVLLDPSQSVVLPTLDFSSTFPITSPFLPPLSRSNSDRDTDFFSCASSDSFSDADLNSDSESWVNTRGPSRFGFSSEFAARFDENRPREVMF